MQFTLRITSFVYDDYYCILYGVGEETLRPGSPIIPSTAIRLTLSVMRVRRHITLYGAQKTVCLTRRLGMID